MSKYIVTIICFIFLWLMTNVHANINKTTRIPQFSNDEVTVWKTLIYPSKDQVLKMHRHEHNRVIVALDAGTLKIINDKGKIHYLNLEKNQAYYLKKDIPGELHSDENIGKQIITILVIELKN